MESACKTVFSRLDAESIEMICLKCKHISTDYQSKSVNPHIGLLSIIISQVIFRHELSSSKDITRATRGHTKRLSRNQLKRNGGKCGEKSY